MVSGFGVESSGGLGFIHQEREYFHQNKKGWLRKGVLPYVSMIESYIIIQPNITKHSVKLMINQLINHDIVISHIQYTAMTGWWFGTCFIFPYVGNVIIPTDELIFFRGVGQPPTR